MKDFDDILIVDLYRAIEKDSPQILGVDQKEYDYLVSKYIVLQRGDQSVRERRKFAIDAKIEITIACLKYLEQCPVDEEIYEVLREHGWKISEETLKADVELIVKGIKGLIAKSETMRKEISPETSNSKRMTIFEILAFMSSGLELYLDPKRVTVSEFLAYQNVLEKKTEKIKTMKNGTK